MNNDSVTKGAAALVNLRRAAVTFNESFMSPEMAVKGLEGLLVAVDELRDVSRPEPYIPAMGETVTIQGIVEEVREDGRSFKVRFSEGTYDYEWVDPTIVPVRPA